MSASAATADAIAARLADRHAPALAALGQRAPRVAAAARSRSLQPANPVLALDLMCHAAVADPTQVQPWLERGAHRDALDATLLRALTVLGTAGARAALPELEGVIAGARITADAPILAWALAAAGRASVQSGGVDRALVFFHEAHPVARRQGLRVLELTARCHLDTLHADNGEAAAYIEEIRATLGLALDAGDDQAMAHAHANLGQAQLRIGQLEEARASFEAALGTDRDADHPFERGLALAGLGELRCWTGDPDGGAEAFAAARAALSSPHHAARRLWTDLTEARLRFGLGEHATAGALAARVSATAADLKNRHLESRSRELESAIAEALGEPIEALAALRKSLELERARLELRSWTAAEATRRTTEQLRAVQKAAEAQQRSAELERANQSLEQALQHQQALQAELRAVARTDPLTGLANRRALDERLAWLVRHAHRTAQPLAVVMLDLDFFKGINDQHGHTVGDEVLQGLARRVLARIRATDTFARWGGEEFCLLLPDTTAVAAERLCGELQASVAGAPFETRAGLLPITTSIGLTSRDPAERDPGPLLQRADRALYRAKALGRNRVHALHPHPEEQTAGAQDRLTASPRG